MKSRFGVLFATIFLLFVSSISYAKIVPPWFELKPKKSILDSVVSRYPKDGRSFNGLREDEKLFLKKMAAYLTFLKLPDDSLINLTKNRLFRSAPYFLICEDITDWVCIEQFNSEHPSNRYLPPYRKENVPFGASIPSGTAFKFKLFFMPGIESEKEEPALDKFIAEIKNADKQININAYGFDNLDGVLSGVYEAIKDRHEHGVNVRAIFDHEQAVDNPIRSYDVVEYKRTSERDGSRYMAPKIIPLPFGKFIIPSYVKPTNPDDLYYWIFSRPAWMDNENFRQIPETEWRLLIEDAKELDNLLEQYAIAAQFADKIEKLPGDPVPLDGFVGGYETAMRDIKRCVKGGLEVRIPFQYDGNIMLINLLNEGITANKESRARVEVNSTGKDAGILHNKAVTFDNKHTFAGTANFSENEIGTGATINASLMIDDKNVTGAFNAEFMEMWDFSGDGSVSKRGESIGFPIGKLHTDKEVNTNRYFTYDDGTEVRLFFAPTDDAEHRAVIPFFYDSEPGDNFRVMIFGASGTELLRSMQYALAKGANITIVFDNSTGTQPGGLIRANYINLCEEKRNPYRSLFEDRSPGGLEMHLGPLDRFQHAKAASLVRNGKATTLIIGSQNWSESGNDKNDENLIIIRNNRKELDETARFNKFFDQVVKSRAEDPARRDPCEIK